MSDTTPIKILLIDNHPLVLDGLKALLETYSNIDVIGTAGLARTGLEIALRNRPDVVLMDINMPHVNGIDAIELFKAELPGIRILMLSMHDSREYISTSVLRGAWGYILKDVSTDEIITAIEAVDGGNTYFSSGVSDVLLERKPGDDTAPLTSREKDVLRLLAAGRSNRDIGDSLGISAATVETHRKHLKKKLGIATTAGLTRYVIENGLT